MNYDEAVEYIERLSPTQVRPGFERFCLFMKEEGQIQDAAPCIHIGGTNGKGSVTTIVAETLNQAGLHTAKYTGPHLFAFNERYDVAGNKISNEDFARICSAIKNKSEHFAVRHPEQGTLTWFEILTAIAFFYFAEKKLDASIFEVGLGGRFDATSVVSKPLATAIVTVSLDHTHILGNTVEEIAGEKAGIIKPEIPLVTACTDRALQIILSEASSKQAAVIQVNADAELFAANAYASELVGLIQEKYAQQSKSIQQTIKNQKSYQRINASVAAALLALWEIKTQKNCLQYFYSALSFYFWPGRLQYFEEHNLLLDGAHNIDGARALRKTIDDLFPDQSRCFILSFYKSKQFKDIMSILLRSGDHVYAAQASGKRAVVSTDEIVKRAEALGCVTESFPDLPSAFTAAEAFGTPALPAENKPGQSQEIAESILPASVEKANLRIGCGSFATVSAGLIYLGYKNVQDSQLDSRNL